MDKISFEEFAAKVKAVEFSTCTSGRTKYILVKYDDANNIYYGIRRVKDDKEFQIDVKKMYDAYCELEVVNVNTLKPYLDGAHSPARAILKAAKLI